MSTCLTVENAQSHVTAFQPISEAARSWSDDKNSWAHKLKGYRENDIWCSTENAEVDDAMCHNQSFFYWISKLFTIKQWLATAMCYAVQYILQDYISKYTKTVVGNKQFCQTRMAGYTGYKFVAGNWKQSTIYTLQYCTNINEHVISTAY